MAFNPKLTYPSLTDKVWFHAYIVASVIGIRWGKFTPTSANSNRDINDILREYLAFACEDDEWTKGRILEAIRGETATSVKSIVRGLFPSLFPRNKRARPLQVPEKLEGEQVNFDLDKIEAWKERVKAIKKEITMSENTTETEATENGSQSIDRKPRKAKVNFIIPPGIDPATITLENYREITKARFRMTKDQKDVRGLSREEAFQESKALAISQLGGN